MAAEEEVKEAIHSVLARLSNIQTLKPEQEECLSNFIAGKDVVALLPTGFGKSLIFQLAPLVAKEVARLNASEANPIIIVVSPLLALMEDQVKEAEKLGVSAGQLGVHDDRDILEGRFSLVFGSPESWLLNSKWRRMLSSPVYQENLIGITVDEVHVTYKWGEASKGESPFRDSFAKLGELRSIAKEGTPLLALTASADIKSRNRVIRLLHMDNATHIIASPNKKNIRLGLCKVPSDEMNCFDWLVQHVKDKGPTMQPVLIYCQTLKIVGRVFSYLKAELQDFAWVGCDQHRKSDNLLIGMFHSKTLPQHKDRVLASLGGGGGDCRVVVATTALGMGLNFPNVSHVVIYGVPGDLESIIQQVGRAGRNGQQSHGIIYNTGRHFKGGEELKEVLAASKTTCFRKSLYSHFEAEPSAVEPGHLCCTYCQTVCSCSSGTCAEPTPDYEQIREKAGTQRSRHVTAEDRSLIADLLNGYRASLISPSIRLFTSQEACTGFSQQLVDSVLNHCQYIFDLSYIIANLPVFRLDHAKEILIIISDVFGDVDEDLQSDSGGDFTETDLYYSNYFDNADDDDADVLRSHASSSESEQ